MAEVKPLTQEQRGQVRANAEAWGWDTEHVWPNSVVLGLLATLAAVEKERDEAQENAKLYNADMMKVREQRDELLAKIARLRRGFSDTLEAEYAHAVRVAEMFVSGRALALMQEAYDHACKGNDRMCAAVLLADAGPLLVHHAGSTGSKTFRPTSGTHAEYVHGDEPRNPYRAKHDPIREDAWNEGYGEAHEHYCVALAASQASARELREALDRLARLGNEPHYGNSDGNRIAQAALARADEVRTSEQ